MDFENPHNKVPHNSSKFPLTSPLKMGRIYLKSLFIMPIHSFFNKYDFNFKRYFAFDSFILAIVILIFYKIKSMMRCENDTEKVEKIKDEAFMSPDSSISSVEHGCIKSLSDYNNTNVNCRTLSNKSTCSDKCADEIVKIEQGADVLVKSEPVEYQNESVIDSKQMFAFSLLDVDKDLLIDKIELKTGISNITDITLTNSSESNADNAENIPAQTSNIISNIQPPTPNFDSYKFKMPVLKKFVKKELVEGIEEITFHCNICSYKTNVSCSLRNHLKNEHISTLHLCDHCKTFFLTKKSLASHNSRFHRSSKSFKCSKCNFFADSYSALSRHRMALHRKRYNCNKCNFISNGSSNLKQHQVTQHYNKDEHSNIISSIQPPILNFDSYKFKMPVLKKFVQKELVEGIEEITFHCNMCSYKTNVSCSLRNHLKNEHISTLHLCDQCNLLFLTKRSLASHNSHKIALHRKRYNCNNCTFVCYASSTLKQHQVIRHYNEAEHSNMVYSCNICNKKCISIRKLDIHRRKHTGERPYACKLCDYKTSQQGLLSKHELHHHRPKQFCCSICTKKFSIESDLNKHFTIHSNYKCSYCSFTDCTKALLAMHHKTNHSDKILIVNPKPYQCDTCFAGFRRQCALKAHKLYWCKGRNKSIINSITISVPNTKIKVSKIESESGNIRKMDPVKKVGSSNEKSGVTNKNVFICESCNEYFSALKVLNRHLKYCKFHIP